MEFKKGEVVKGKVTGIAKFGAFVELAPGKSGLVYISEIANTFVKEVSDFLTVGQEVMVKIINVEENGRINLSIKQAAPAQERPRQERRDARPPQSSPQVSFPSGEEEPPRDAAFEDKLKRFMKDSDSKMSDIRRQSERRGSRRRRG